MYGLLQQFLLKDKITPANHALPEGIPLGQANAAGKIRSSVLVVGYCLLILFVPRWLCVFIWFARSLVSFCVY
jgi:hypothetical protein